MIEGFNAVGTSFADGKCEALLGSGGTILGVVNFSGTAKASFQGGEYEGTDIELAGGTGPGGVAIDTEGQVTTTVGAGTRWGMAPMSGEHYVFPSSF